MASFGERLKSLRLFHKFTIKELSEQLGLSPRMISFFEAGQREPNLETILKISDIFNCSVDYLLGKENQPYSVPTTEVPLVSGVVNGEFIVEDTFPLPESMILGKKAFMYQVHDDNLINFGMYPEDFLVVIYKDEVKEGEVTVFLKDDEFISGVVSIQEDVRFLYGSNATRPPVVLTEEHKLIGKVVGVFRSIPT